MEHLLILSKKQEAENFGEWLLLGARNQEPGAFSNIMGPERQILEFGSTKATKNLEAKL